MRNLPPSYTTYCSARAISKTRCWRTSYFAALPGKRASTSRRSLATLPLPRRPSAPTPRGTRFDRVASGLAEGIRPVRAVPLQAAESAAYRAYFLVRVGLIEEAKQVLERARAEGNPTSLAYEALGMLLTGHGNGLAGLEAYRRAVELDSGNASAQYQRGILALELAGDDGEEGMAALAAAVHLEPNLAAAHLAIARALMGAHETLDEACQRAEGAARLEPGGIEHLADLLRVCRAPRRRWRSDNAGREARGGAIARRSNGVGRASGRARRARRGRSVAIRAAPARMEAGRTRECCVFL